MYRLCYKINTRLLVLLFFSHHISQWQPTTLFSQMRGRSSLTRCVETNMTTTSRPLTKIYFKKRGKKAHRKHKIRLKSEIAIETATMHIANICGWILCVCIVLVLCVCVCGFLHKILYEVFISLPRSPLDIIRSFDTKIHLLL